FEVLFEHVEAFGEKRHRLIPIRPLFQQRQQYRRIAQRDGAERERDWRPRRIARRKADVEQRRGRLRVSGHTDSCQPHGGAAQQLLKPEVLVGKLQRLAEKVLVRLTIDAEQTDGCGNRRLELARGAALQLRERLQRPFVADFSQRQRGIVLQRSVEPGDGHERVEGVRRLVVTQRFDDRAAEKILAAADFFQQRGARRRALVAWRGRRSGGKRA